MQQKQRIIERIKRDRDEIKKRYHRQMGKLKRLRLKCKNFTIISNNCFGGVFYRNNALPYASPTCGMFFMAEEYIKFIYQIKKYLYAEIKEIPVEESKYKDYLKLIQYKGIIGKLEDVEICFLHYENIEEIREKWEARAKRVNFDKMIYKFSDQNLCSYEHLKKFNEFPAENKICFTAKKYEEFDTIWLKQYRKVSYVLEDVFPKNYKRYLNMYDYINTRMKDKK